MSASITRRKMIRSGAGMALVGPVAAPLAGLVAGCADDGSENTPASTATTEEPPKLPAPRNGDEALERLLEGNRRYRAGEDLHPDRDPVRRVELAEGQEPFAVIVGCADSRVPPEVIFDEGLGKLFVVRIAGNTAVDPLVVGSVEYSIEHLGSVLVMILGHEGCGAVKGAVAVATEGAEEPGAIGEFIAPIVPVVEGVLEDEPGSSAEGLVAPSIRANVRKAVDDLAHADELIEEFVDSGEVKIVGAEYLLESGEVKLL